MVDGTKIPDVDFDIGESYAGLLPISDAADETRKLFFWSARPPPEIPKPLLRHPRFFPSSNPQASDEIALWYANITLSPRCPNLQASGSTAAPAAAP